MDRPTVEMKRVAIECTPADAADVPAGDTSDELLRAYKPIPPNDILHRARELSRELFLTSSGNFGFTDDAPAEDLPGVRLTPEAPGTRLSQPAIERVKDHADHFHYWALYESRFPEEHSCVCAEEEALVALLSMLPYSRSPVVLAALQVLQALVANPNTARFLGRVPINVLVDVPTEQEAAENEGGEPALATLLGVPSLPASATSDDDAASRRRWARSDLCQLLFACARRFPNKADVQVLVIGIARHVAPQIIERYLTADLVSAVLAAMKTHKGIVEVQREAVLLFSETVNVPRADPQDAPVALLYVHVGEVVEYVLAAAQLMPTSSDVAHAAVTTLLAMAQRVENDDELAGTRALHVLAGIIDRHKNNVDLVSDALAAASSMTRWMDDTQRRGFCVTIRKVMMESTEPAVLAACCAVLHVTLQQYEREIVGLTAVAAAAGDDATAAEAANVEAEARYEALQALRGFCAAQKLPQLMHIALEHFGEDSADLIETARLALSSLVLKRMPTAERLQREREMAQRAEAIAQGSAAAREAAAAVEHHADPEAGVAAAADDE